MNVGNDLIRVRVLDVMLRNEISPKSSSFCRNCQRTRQHPEPRLGRGLPRADGRASVVLMGGRPSEEGDPHPAQRSAAAGEFRARADACRVTGVPRISRAAPVLSPGSVLLTYTHDILTSPPARGQRGGRCVCGGSVPSASPSRADSGAGAGGCRRSRGQLGVNRDRGRDAPRGSTVTASAAVTRDGPREGTCLGSSCL